VKYRHVRIAGVGHDLPARIVTSEELEERLAPVYDRLRLRVGRLELMTGIRERRFYEPGTLPSDAAARAGESALARSGIDRVRVGVLVHASVCRDFLEPATATVVHRALGLPDACEAFDLSNACLGVMSAMVQVADAIELGRIEAGLIVAGEDGRPLVEQTIAALLADEDVTRESIKRAFASLTIGSGGAAVVLARTDDGDAPGRLLGGATMTATQHNVLCQGGNEAGLSGPLMSTDAEALLHAGNELAARTFEEFLGELAWTRDDIERVVTHQVGAAHRKLLFETLDLDPERDFPTVATLGNVGSVSVPASLSLAVDAGFVERGRQVALLGIGSGLGCLMLGARW
jgi:3-oxoacyl-[acyl-carrier-protein] synthase-3